MFASHPLHPNVSARSFESPEQSGKMETRIIANGRIRHRDSHPSAPGASRHLSSSGANFPGYHQESVHPDRCWQFGLRRRELERWRSRSKEEPGFQRAHQCYEFHGVPLPRLSLTLCSRNSLRGDASVWHNLGSLLSSPSFFLGGSSCLEKPPRII